MNAIDQLKLAPNQREALGEIRDRLFGRYEIESISLFGSVVRGEADAESDIDLLIVTRVPLRRSARHQITDIVWEINTKHDTNFSTLVVDREAWERGMFSVLPIREEILREGIVL